MSLAKLIRAYLTDIAGKKADLIISSALFRRVMLLRLVDRPSSAGAYANNLREFEAVREFMTSASLLTIVDLPFSVTLYWRDRFGRRQLGLGALNPGTDHDCVGLFVQRPLARYINESMKESSQKTGSCS